MAAVKTCHICQAGNVEQLEEFEKLLPPGYSHLLCAKEEEKVQLRVRVSATEEVEKWLQDFQKSSGLIWRKARTYPLSGRYNMYRADFRCQHKTYGTSPKNTNCPATLFLVLKRSVEDRRSRSSDKHMAEGFLMNVSLRTDHNHPCLCADTLSKRDVSSTTTQKLAHLFQRGHSPSSALDTLKYDLQKEEGQRDFLTAADRAVVPDIQFCCRLYYKIFKKAYGAPSGENMMEDSKTCVVHCNSEQDAQKEERTGQVTVAICTPLVQQIHGGAQQSGELVLVDSSRNPLTDFANNRVVKLLPKTVSHGGVDCQTIVQLDEQNVLVPSAQGPSNLWYTLNTAPCKHQSALSSTIGSSETSHSQSTSPLRKPIHETVSGTQEESGTTTGENLTRLEKELDDWVEGLKKKLRQDKSYYGPVQSFLQSASKLNTDSGVQSALCGYGKSILRPIKVRPRGNLQSPTTTGVQPTKRKEALGGRKNLDAGRPPKSARKDHQYHQQEPLKSV